MLLQGVPWAQGTGGESKDTGTSPSPGRVCHLEKKRDGSVCVPTHAEAALEGFSPAAEAPHSTGLRAEMRRPRSQVVACWAGVWGGG